jgi:hypothetical protein
LAAVFIGKDTLTGSVHIILADEAQLED